VDALTAREQELAALIARGFTNARIAESLGVSERTVRNRLTTIFQKLRVRSRLQLAVRLRVAAG